MTAKFQLYDEEAEIQLGPQGKSTLVPDPRHRLIIKGETLIPPVNERSTLELLSQGSEPFRVLDGYVLQRHFCDTNVYSFEFKQNEIVLCLQSVNLESQSTTLGRRDFIAVGTGFNYAEDRASRGGVRVPDKLVSTLTTSGLHLRGCRNCAGPYGSRERVQAQASRKG